MEIIFIAGLPGSGKTKLINNQYKVKNDYLIFDDVKANAVLNCGNFTFSRYYPIIVKAIQKNLRNIVISDISFCDYTEFKNAVDILNWWIKDCDSNYNIKAIIFKNEKEKCIKNIKCDNGKNMENRIEKVCKFSKNYNPDKLKKLVNSSLKNVFR